MSHITAIIKAIESNLATSTLPPLPQLLFTEDLSRITGLSITTIRHYTGNPAEWGHLLPRWFKLPGARRLVWLESDVLDWIAAARAAAPMAKRPRGRPTKIEELRAKGLL